VIILSVRDSEDEIIAALDNGANDYLTKPFRSGELLARIRATIRSSEKKKDEPVLEFGTLSIDMLNHIVKKKDETLKLTSTEFSLLNLLAKNQGRVLTHQYILKEVWGYGYIEQTQYLRVFVAQLRKKIEDNPSKPKLLITESGIGYRFGE
jgi:two-component system KDP operon response regulator KdpE